MVTNFDKEYLENLHLDMLMLKKIDSWRSNISDNGE